MRLNRKISSFEYLIYRHYRIVHGVRIGLAFIITFLLLRLLKVPEGIWPLITLVVVMGPISFWGNVLQRALQRVSGMLVGAVSGLFALYLEFYSLPLMLLWCGVVMFFCGYLTLGKRPFMALLIGITLAAMCGAGVDNMPAALWRGGDVILGSVLALLFSSIYPQHAYTLWRIQMADCLQSVGQIYGAYLSPNVIERPRLETRMKDLLAQVVKLHGLIVPASEETPIPEQVFEAAQTLSRNLVCTLELLAGAYWASRETRFIMLNAKTLRSAQLLTLRSIESLVVMLRDGEQQGDTGELKEITVELKALMQEASVDQSCEAPIRGYMWLSMELVQQLEELSDLCKVCTARGQE
ncbi:membrane protein [Chania multitudinisentens RB-25]|uniref:Membrane protein n=1 Tax=Chania multitudinisentens RB-25 TaxID=1441930 RepID=W0L8F5_9GAMM|nr:FUSC family protein [Chania multitudinisentens]AHG18674.1 membrane protein [Chania multitudinisentens RB-25]